MKKKGSYSFVRRIKDNISIRRIFKPYMDFKLKCEHEKYLGTPDSFYLKTLKNIHIGERCFIIGNGPSLCGEDLDKLKGEYSFAANRIFEIFNQTKWRPTYYLSVDDRVLKETNTDFENYDLGHMFLRYGKTDFSGPINHITRIYIESLQFNVKKICNTSIYVSEDISDHFCDGYTVTYEAIQLAIYMGFSEIYLLGVDHNYSKIIDSRGKIHIDQTIKDYFDEEHHMTSYATDLMTTTFAYTIAREYCDNHGIIIKNATRGGKLEVFERTTIEEILEGDCL